MPQKIISSIGFLLNPVNSKKGENFIDSERSSVVTLANGSVETVNWYHFSIPITSYEKKVGNISDFKNIPFIRLYLKNFHDSIVLRLGELGFHRPYIDDKEPSLSLFPNPSLAGVFHIVANFFIKDMKIYTLYGDEVKALSFSGDFNSYICDLTNNQPGLYIVEANNTEGKSLRRKIVIGGK